MPNRRVGSNQRRDALKHIREKSQRLVLLSQLGQILNSTLEPKEIQKRAIEAATRLMRAEAGSLLLVDGEKRQLYFEVALGHREDDIKTITLNFGEGIAGWVAQRGKPLIVNSPRKDARFFSGVDKRAGFETKNIICVPVKVKKKTIGVLEAVNKKEKGGFNKEDLNLFRSLADQVAIALDNSRLYQELENMFIQTAESLANAIEKRDPYTGGHNQRVNLYCQAIAKQLRLKPSERKWLKVASALHDIGKIGIEDTILRKPRKLTRKEFDRIKSHSTLGVEILGHLRPLRESLPGVKYHHEQPDGKGYPEGLKGEEIPILAKIVAVADTFDAMTSDRPYRKAMGKEASIEELKRCSGTQFDKEVVEAFIRAYQEGEI